MLRILLLGGMVAAAVRTGWVVYHHGFDGERTSSWWLYLLGQRWPWVLLSVGIAAGIAFLHEWDALAVGVFLGHVFSPSILKGEAPSNPPSNQP